MNNSLPNAPGGWPLSASLSRRSLLRRAAGAGVVLASGAVLNACGGGSGGDSAKRSKTLVFAGYGGSGESTLKEAVFDDFQKETGITVKLTTGAYSPVQLKAMVDANRVEWDLVRVSAASLAEARRLNLVSKLDYDQIKIPELVTDKAMTPYALNYNQYAHAIFWNKDLMDRPDNWAGVFDAKKSSGLRGFGDTAVYLPEATMLAAGRSLDDVYPIDVPLMFEVLDEIRSSARFMGSEPLTSLIAAGKVATGDINKNRLDPAIEAGIPIGHHWNQALTDFSGLAVPKGAPNEENAYKLLEYFMRPEVQARIFKILPSNSPVVKETFEGLSEAQMRDMAGSPLTVDQALYLDAEWYTEHGADLSDKFSRWLRSG